MRTYTRWLAALSIGLCSTSPVGFAHAAPPEGAVPPDEAFAAARAAFAQKDYDRAIALLQAAHQIEPRAVYVFNIGRSYEEKGWLREAYDHLVLYPSLPRTVDALREEAAERAARLKPLLARAVVDLSEAGGGSRLELDGGPVDPGVVVVEPGAHVLCVVPESGTPSCWRRKLAAARRVTWPPQSDAVGRSRVVFTPPVTAVTLDDVPVAAGAVLTALELDEGSHTLTLTPSGAPPRELRVHAEAGATVTLELVPEPAPVAATEESDPWPWVLVGVGAASATAGLGLLVAAGIEHGDLSSPTKDGGVITGISQVDAQAGWERVDTFVLSGSILAGAGVALAAGGLTWWALEPSTAPSEPATGGRVWLGATSVSSVGLGGSF